VLFSLGFSRIMVLIQVVSFQGIVISIAPLFIHRDLSGGNVFFCLLMLVIRGFVIPWLLVFVVRKINVRREIEPYIGYHASLAAGLLLMVFSIYISRRFDLPVREGGPLALPTAITVMLTGLFLLMARRKAITMLIGYLMLENGIFLLGTSFSARSQHIVEFGILLDVLAGVMLMGIVLYNIQRAFDDIDTSLLRSLKD